MPSPTTKVVADTPIRRVLSTVERLIGQLEILDLDVIDGEFYWRCCHPHVLPLVDELRLIRDSGAVRYLDDEEGESEERATILRNTLATRWRPFADEASWRTYQRYSETYDAAKEIIPDRMVGEMIDQDLVTMYPPDIAIVHVDRLQLRVDYGIILVHTSSWRGADVEHGIDRAADRVGLVRPAPAKAATHVLNVEMWLERDGERANRILNRMGEPLPRVPCVAVFMPLPLPPRGSVGREYDAVVRGQYRWHLELPGAGASRQDKEVAIRTWGVALLLGAGRQFGQAMRLVCEAGRLSEVSQTQFGVNRQHVIERVSEAKAFLMQRKRAA